MKLLCWSNFLPALKQEEQELSQFHIRSFCLARIMPTQRVILVRHAERADEAPLENIGSIKWDINKRRHDPPLTRRGEEQARIAAKYIVDMCKNCTDERGQYNFEVVHTSQLLRCTQTAAALARELGDAPLRVDAGLAACAKRCRLAAAAGKDLPLASLAELIKAAASHKIEVAPCVRPPPEKADCLFIDTLEELARQQRGIGGLLVVTHREGIRELDRRAGEVRSMAMPYCVVHEYDFDIETGSWKLLHDSPIAKPAVRKRIYDRTFAFASLAYDPSSHSVCNLV